MDIFYLRDMSRISRSGNAYLNLGEAYLQRNEWGLAVKAIKEALKNKALDNRARAFRVLADAYSRQDNKRLSNLAMKKFRAEVKITSCHNYEDI